MNDLAIRVTGLSKKYKIGKPERYKTLRDSLANSITTPIRAVSNLINCRKPIINNGSDNMIWALKNVSFEVKQGEVIGIIGHNGAGKSTLLKILSQITEPTEGLIKIHGRVGSLLEVGTGFHPELTGRENIYLYGAILGMKKVEIDRKFDEIIAFAEVEKFIDTSLKHYSSGMYMRLAFSVASHMEPEILLVDEVLAVGDVKFQKKCLGKMGEVGKEGRTVLFVSHNLAAIRQLCHEGILLGAGKVLFMGPAFECANNYLELSSNHSGSIMNRITKTNPTVIIDSVTVNGSAFDQVHLAANTPFLKIEIAGRITQPTRMDMEARLFDIYSTPLAFFSPGHEKGYAHLHPAGPFSIVKLVKLPRMVRGQYYLDLFLTNPDIAGWVDIPQAVWISAEGTPTASGRVFDYEEGRGWIFLPGGID